MATTPVTSEEVPEERQPEPVSASAYTIRAGGDIPNINAGQELPDMDAVAVAMASKLDTLRGVEGSGKIVVASVKTLDDPTEERTLKPGDAMGNAKKVRDFLANKEHRTPEGLIAAAWCAPRAPIYDVPTVGTTRRPVRDALPSFTADRGGVVWMQPPVVSAVDASVSLWRHDAENGWESFTDVLGLDATDPAATKPCLIIPCGEEVTADVDAIPVCFCFDNLTAKAFPEWIRGNTDLVLVHQARFAEQVALSQMFGVVSTGSCGSVTTAVGVARDFMIPVRAAAASMRWDLRMDSDEPLQLLAPWWLLEAIAADLSLQAPGDDAFNKSTAEINAYFGEFNVQPIWYIDDVPGTDSFTGCVYPATAHWLLFPTGTFTRLDNGELNLGVIRTKEDVQKNRYCEFSETFETVAYFGPAGNEWVTRGLTEVNIFGSYALGTDTVT